MSGHSKWANIKHRKERSDAQKSQVFTRVTREIIIATRHGGGDPDSNFRLRLAVQKAREVNMPNDNIMRAIKRGTGAEEGTAIEEVTYEGYGPGGAALLIRVLTDNRNRSASEIRHTLTRHGGSMGEVGCVAWMFELKGLVTIDPEFDARSEEELLAMAMETGAEDLHQEDGVFTIITSPAAFESVRRYLEDRKIPMANAELGLVAKSTVPVGGHTGEHLTKLLEALDEHDDVQSVYGNFVLID